MDQAEFDKFAEEYRQIHAQNIKASGEAPEYFAEYKVRDTAGIARDAGYPGELKILDFGAGTGTSVTFFKQFFPAASITCLDVSIKSLEIGESRYSGMAEFKHFDGKTIPFADNSFHIVFAACVFHHIDAKEHVRLLSELRRIIKPGGMMIVFEHNPLNPLTVQAVRTCVFDENAVLIQAGAMLDRFKQAGFSAPKRSFRLFFPGPFRKLRFLEKYLVKVPFGAQYYVVAKKQA